MIRRVFYTPPNYFVTRFSSEDRRMFGFWVLVFAIVGTVILKAVGVPDSWWLLWITALSVVALVPNYTTETPVEQE